MDLEKFIMDKFHKQQEEVRNFFPLTYDDLKEEIMKAKRAQVGEIREWGGVKMQKTANGWIPVKEGAGKPKTGEEPGKEGGEAPSLEDHAKRASEAALQNAIKNSPDAEVRAAAHRELQRRDKEEKSEMFKKPEGDQKESSKANDENNGDAPEMKQDNPKKEEPEQKKEEETEKDKKKREKKEKRAKEREENIAAYKVWKEERSREVEEATTSLNKIKDKVLSQKSPEELYKSLTPQERFDIFKVLKPVGDFERFKEYSNMSLDEIPDNGYSKSFILSTMKEALKYVKSTNAIRDSSGKVNFEKYSELMSDASKPGIPAGLLDNYSISDEELLGLQYEGYLEQKYYPGHGYSYYRTGKWQEDKKKNNIKKSVSDDLIEKRTVYKFLEGQSNLLNKSHINEFVFGDTFSVSKTGLDLRTKFGEQIEHELSDIKENSAKASSLLQEIGVVPDKDFSEYYYWTIDGYEDKLTQLPMYGIVTGKR